MYESKGFVCQSTYRTNVNNVSDKIIVQCLFDISRNFRMISSVHHAMFTFFSQLIGQQYATETHDTSVHVQLDFVTYIDRIKSSLLKIQTRLFQTMIITQILKFTFTCLVTNWTIQWVVDQYKFNHSFTCALCAF